MEDATAEELTLHGCALSRHSDTPTSRIEQGHLHLGSRESWFYRIQWVFGYRETHSAPFQE